MTEVEECVETACAKVLRQEHTQGVRGAERRLKWLEPAERRGK